MTLQIIGRTFFISALTFCTRAAWVQDIRIAVAGAMTGSLAEAGDEVKRGAELAAKLSRPDGLSPWGDGRAAPGLANCV